MAYLQAAVLLVAVVLIVGFLFGGGLVILAVGAALGAITFLVVGLISLVSGFTDSATRFWRRRRR